MINSNFTKLRVSGSRVILQIIFIALIVACSVDSAQAQWTTSGNDIYNSNSGNVAIGVSSGGAKLVVCANSGCSAGNAIQVGNDAFLADLDIANTMGILGAWDPTLASIKLGTGGGTISGYSGNIGIGTTSPTSKLDVNGDVTVSGNISAKYQDLAEWVSTAHALPAGTVVALDTESDNGIVPSSVPYDTRVAGVVSDSPGIILGVAGPGKVKIATTGRVKVRVDASNGPIRRGDLLVTGTKEGTAMRSEMVNVGGIEIHRPGTLIGKALEPLETGEGEILVLLSLQ